MKKKEKTIIVPKRVTNENDLKHALDSEATVIYIENPLYSSVVDKVKKSNKGKIINGSGAIAVMIGLLFTALGPIAWATLLGGTVVSILGNSMDSLKNYSVDVNEVSCRIILYRQTGKNKYKTSKHQIAY